MMIHLLKDNWNKYKELKAWKKALLFIPIVLLAVLCISFFFFKPKSYKDKYVDGVKHNKKQVDEQIAINKEEQARFERLDRELVRKQVAINKKLEENHERTKEINSDINDAVSNNNAAKLKRIHAKLNNKSRRR